MSDNSIKFHTLNITDVANMTVSAGSLFSLSIEFEVCDALVFDLDAVVQWRPKQGSEAVYTRHLGQDGYVVFWLPRGHYRLEWITPRLNLPEGEYELLLAFEQTVMGEKHLLFSDQKVLSVTGGKTLDISGAWHLETLSDTTPVVELPWRKGYEDWFYRHFDHAALTISSYMLNNSQLLKGRILDVGCGDGITDLGICLRCQPELMIGIDPFKGFERLPDVLRANNLSPDIIPPQLSFKAADGNHIPFPDDSFDVVISWGSVEHIAGGYLQTLREIKRVLKKDGLLFIHPGLYYSNYGHHIGEFSNEPFVHLTRTEEELKDIVLNTPPQYMDRAGEFSPPEQYWQWYKELNPITVAEFERELKTLEFDFYRAALRTENLIEYHHPALQNYGMQDLATVELYISAYNRKLQRPADLVIESVE